LIYGSIYGSQLKYFMIKSIYYEKNSSFFSITKDNQTEYLIKYLDFVSGESIDIEFYIYD
jgi:hypothetical protein